MKYYENFPFLAGQYKAGFYTTTLNRLFLLFAYFSYRAKTFIEEPVGEAFKLLFSGDINTLSDYTAERLYDLITDNGKILEVEKPEFLKMGSEYHFLVISIFLFLRNKGIVEKKKGLLLDVIRLLCSLKMFSLEDSQHLKIWKVGKGGTFIIAISAGEIHTYLRRYKAEMEEKKLQALRKDMLNVAYVSLIRDFGNFVGNFTEIKDQFITGKMKSLINNNYFIYRNEMLQVTSNMKNSHLIGDLQIEMTLDDLAEKENMSLRCKNVCGQNQLFTLADIIDYGNKNMGFHKLQHCGEKTEKELEAICLKYKTLNTGYITKLNDNAKIADKKAVFSRWLQTIGLDEIAQWDEMGKYVRKVCENHELTDLEKIINSLKNRQEFSVLKGGSGQTYKKLKSICSKYVNMSLEEIIELCVNQDGSKSLQLLETEKREQLNTFIYWLCFTLDGMAKKAINEWLKTQSEAYNILNHFKKGSLEISQWAGIGKNTIDKKLIPFKTNLINYIKVIHNDERSKFITDYLKLVLNIYARGIVYDPDSLISKLKSPEGKVYLFSLIDTLVDLELFLSPDQRIVFNFLYTPQSKRMRVYRKETGISTYLFEQGIKCIPNNLWSMFGLITELKLEDLTGFEQYDDNGIIVVNENFVKERSADKALKFTNTFYASILDLFFHKKYCLYNQLPGEESLVESNRPKYFRNGYLVNTELAKVFDFTTFISSLSEIVPAKRSMDFKEPFDDYIKKFLIALTVQNFDEIKKVCETILLQEFQLALVEEILFLPRNCNKRIDIIVEELLLELGKVSHVSAICELAQKRYPEYEITEQQITSAVGYYKKTFIQVGKKYSYALKAWETEKPGVKGGTIREIAAEYLHQFSDPQPKAEIYSYVKKYRDTTNESIEASLRSMRSINFIFFESGYIGIAGKEYSEYWVKQIKVKK